MIYFSNLTQLTQWGPFVNIDHFVSKEECSKLIALMPDRKLVQAKVSTDGLEDTSIRSTKLCSLELTDKTAWIFQNLKDAICQVNNDVYKMELMGFDEAINLMQYSEGDFYSWHMDSGNLQFSKRKLSFSVQLSDENDYEGGDLEFFKNGSAPRKQGTLIIFPSYLYHRVLPITKGIRRGLVGWVNGQSYR